MPPFTASAGSKVHHIRGLRFGHHLRWRVCLRAAHNAKAGPGAYYHPPDAPAPLQVLWASREVADLTAHLLQKWTCTYDDLRKLYVLHLNLDRLKRARGRRARPAQDGQETRVFFDLPSCLAMLGLSKGIGNRTALVAEE